MSIPEEIGLVHRVARRGPHCHLGPLAAAALALLLAWSPALALDSSVPYVNGDDVHAMGITGAGEVIGLLDVDAADQMHPNLPNLTLVVDYSGGGLSIGAHPTEVTGVIGSSVPGITGMVPGAQLYSIDYGSGPYAEEVRTNAIMDAMYSLAQEPIPNATIWNMSAKLMDVAADGQSQLARFLDYFTHTNDVVFTKSSGNSTTIRPPGGAFNIITVGATGVGTDPNVNYESVAFFSGAGELSDGRSKPDIVAPGQQITSTTTPYPPLTSTNNGTSGAAPHVAGAAALLREFADNYNKIDDHRLIKAVLLNAADKDGGEKTQEKFASDRSGNLWMPPVPGSDPLDAEMGAGQLNALASITQYTPPEALAGFQASGVIEVDPIHWDFNTIDPFATVDYAVQPKLAQNTKLTATVAWDRIVSWNDHGSVSGIPDFDDTFIVDALANLDIVLLDGEGLELALLDDLGRASFSTSTVDTTEHIYYTLPEEDFYTLRVKNMSDLETTFGLALWSHPLPGDVNGDGFIDSTDLGIVIGNWGLSGATPSQGDLNGNSMVDGFDYTEVISYWNPPSEPPSGTPEPATLVLLALGAAAVLLRKRRA